MLRLSAQTQAAISASRFERVVEETAQKLAQSSPEFVEALGPVEFRRRVAAGVGASFRHKVELECDLRVLTLAHVMIGRDFLARDEFGWALSILEESGAVRDDRVFRIHEALSTID